MVILFVGLSFSFGCKTSQTAQNGEGKNQTASSNKNTTASAKPVPKADFTMSADMYNMEFQMATLPKDLKQYAGKNITLTGRVLMVQMEKGGTSKPYMAFKALGSDLGPTCDFDDENLEQMKQLKVDNTVTVQGVEDETPVPKVHPRLKNCIVLEAK